MTTQADPQRPPSVDALARSLAASGLPHPLLVDVARAAIEADAVEDAMARAVTLRRTLLTPVVNATGVLLHTNLGRAPLRYHQDARAMSVELDLESGGRGSRQRAVGSLLARAAGAEAAMVVNNNAAAVLLVLAAVAPGRGVAVSRGESVEIGGGFRVPEVMEQSGARLVDVGTTNRTRRDDYERAIERDPDLALILKVHPSNYRIEGFVEEASVGELAALGVSVVADLGSGLLDATCPWWPGGTPPAWLAHEPAAVQTLAAGAALVTFSADKLFGGPQAGVIAGRAELVERCLRHPLARALRPGGLVLGALQEVTLAYLRRDVCTTVPFWRMASAPVDELQRRAAAIAADIGGPDAGAGVEVVATAALPGAGSAPGATIASAGLALAGDHLARLRAEPTPIIARVRDGRTVLDLRTVDPSDDELVLAALRRR
jgi:L-seryl-tRNA(Ser) seleniumtransferase